LGDDRELEGDSIDEVFQKEVRVRRSGVRRDDRGRSCSPGDAKLERKGKGRRMPLTPIDCVRVQTKGFTEDRRTGNRGEKKRELVREEISIRDQLEHRPDLNT